MASELSNYRLHLLTSGNNYSGAELDNLTEHNFITQFVEGMANSLSIWDNHTESIEYYEKLSWAGLESTNAYQVQSNKTEIQNVIQNENTSNGRAKSTKCD